MKNEQNVFKLHAPYQPTGDQPQAIAELVKGFKEGNLERWGLCKSMRLYYIS